MNLRKVSLYLLCLTIGVSSCKKDDDPDPVVIEIRDRAGQQIIDNDSLIGYLETHYYNSDVINSLKPNVSISDLVIAKLADGETDAPVGHTLLKKGDVFAVEKISIKYADTDYEYYVLNLNQGGGDSPKFCDDIRVNYEGLTLDDVVFDYSVNPVDFDLATEVAVEGWRRVFPEFKTAGSFGETINVDTDDDGVPDASDGTVTYLNKGLGVMFLPSGLAYFSNASGGIPAYSPLIFKFELLQMAQNDHDGDGIPSYLEDLDEDGLLAENTDEDSYPSSGLLYPLYNYLDTDDDGDGILTKDEITITTINEPTINEVKGVSLEYNQVLLNKIKKEQDGSYTGTIITFKDTDGVGPFDYLDKNH